MRCWITNALKPFFQNKFLWVIKGPRVSKSWFNLKIWHEKTTWLHFSVFRWKYRVIATVLISHNRRFYKMTKKKWEQEISHCFWMLWKYSTQNLYSYRILFILLSDKKKVIFIVSSYFHCRQLFLLYLCAVCQEYLQTKRWILNISLQFWYRYLITTAMHGGGVLQNCE
jgi:hypothetical protein